MPGPVGQQVVHDFIAGVHVFPGSRPANDAEFMVIAFTDGIGAVFDEETNEGEELLFRGKVQRVGIVALAANVRVGAVLEEKPHSRFALSKDSVMQSSSHAGPGGFVDQARISCEQGIEARKIATACRILQRSDRLFQG